jgi:hypothetical protein
MERQSNVNCILSCRVTHFGNEALYRSLEEICGRARVPLPVPFGEVLGYDVAGNTCEGHIALSPLLEAKVESVVLDPLDTADAILCQVSSFISPLPFRHERLLRTAVTLPPRWLATAFAIEGFSATHSTFILLACCGEHRACTRGTVTRQKSYKLARESALNRDGASRWC